MSTLTYKPVMWTHDGATLKATDPAFRYEVMDERGRTIGFITNLRAAGRTPCWEISCLRDDGAIVASTGEYTTAEDALSAFQKEPRLLKGYVRRWKEREKPEPEGIDYWFTSHPENAAWWKTREDAENECVVFEANRIRIPSSAGGVHTCRGFKVEERAPGEFVIYCMAPFVLQSSEIAPRNGPVSLLFPRGTDHVF